MTPEYEYRRLDDSNVSAAIVLIKNATGKSYSGTFFKKKLQLKPGSSSYHGYIVFDKKSGQSAAFAAAITQRMKLPDGQIINASQWIDLVTAPEHRGKGLSTKILHKILDDQREAGEKLAFCFCKTNSEYIVTHKLGFTKLNTLLYYLLPVRTLPFEAICRRCRVRWVFRWWANRVLKEYRVPEGFVMENALLETGIGGIIHDSSYFKYKTYTFNKICRFSGIDAWLKFEHGLLVGDVQLPKACPTAQFDNWLQTLYKIAKRMGLKQIIFQVTPDTQLERCLSERMKGHASLSVCYKALDPSIESQLSGLRFGYGDFDTF